MLRCLRTYGWALFSGIVMAWAFPTFHLYPLAWIGLVPLLAVTRTMTERASAVQFLVAGWAFNSIVLQWLVSNVFWAGGWAIFGHQGISIALSCYWALAGVLWVRMNQRLPLAGRAAAFALCWIAMEWLQARLFTGLGWAALGYSQGPDAWFSQLAALGGVLLVSGVLVATNVLLSQAWTGRTARLRLLAAATLLCAAAHGLGYLLYGQPDTLPAKPFQVGLYQSNYSQEMKWDGAFQDTMLDMAVEQSLVVAEAEAVDLFVWPEGLIMSDYKTPHLLTTLESFVAESGTALFFGTGRHDRDKNAAYNSSVYLAPDHDPEVYDKMKLAPFGEYIPFGDWLSFAQDLGAMGGTTPGDTARVFTVGDRAFGPLICFEVLFAPLADERRELGADFLVVVTNLGWFGQTNVLSQKLEIARFRAIENRLPVVQCANTGISGVIDPWGRIAIIDGAVTESGRYLTWKTPPPRSDAMVHRRVGALPLPEAASLPLPGAMRWFGRLATLGAALLALWLFLPSKKTTATP